MHRRGGTTAWMLGRAARVALCSRTHAHGNSSSSTAARAASVLTRASFATKAGKGAANGVRVRRKKSVLVDGNNVLYHFYNPLQAAGSDGVQREAVDGLIRLLQRMDKTHAPEHICVFFDSKRKPTTRKLMDPAYKSLRKPTPQSLGPQLASAAGVLRDGGVNCISVPGFEADDLIASYTEAYVAAGYEVLVVSNDNDFLQLARGVPTTAASDALSLQDNSAASAAAATAGTTAATDSSSGFVELYQPNKRRYVRERHVQSRFGLPHARLVPAYLALVGTRWGKIQKVEHMTDERAVALLAQYGSLPKLLRNLNAVEDPALRKSLKHAISSIETALRIAQLNDQIALPLALDEMATPALENLAVAAPSTTTRKTEPRPKQVQHSA